MSKKNLKPMINEEELTKAAKAAYESHKKNTVSEFRGCIRC